QTTGNSVVSTAYAATGAKLLITYVSTTDSGAYRSTAVQNSTIGYTHDSWLIYGGDYNMLSKASIQLEYDWLATASETDRYNLLFHEFGHALGLSHVSDTSQVMNPFISSQDLFRLGDRTGLWQLAQQPCH
ncbi:MAG TPA: matrixin family metalloprotease, partial [Candidatus Nanopelagicales bacterium]|nr:matrixin family metalloprotease [Candidatus Nanopelagicales bacterium]